MKCEKCGSFETQTVEKLAHTHTVIKVVEATCTKEGENLIKCEMCGDSQTQKVEKLAHTPVDVEEVVATCTDTGRGKGSSCSVCHTMLSEEEIIPAKGHSYKNCEIQQTCGVDGCILYECACGDSYKTNIVRATNAHDFQRNFEGIGYTCHTCGLEVVEHGNVDGSTSGDNNIVKYYITGEDYEDISRTLVIYGSGDMPDFGGISSPDSLTPGWLSSYMYAVDTVIIESGVTYIGENAFAEIYGEPSYYDGIKKFIIRSEDIQIAEYPNGDDHRVSGIKCKITFEY